MKDEFIKERNIVDRGKTDTYKELMNNINFLKKSLEKSYANLQIVNDRDLVDYYTYKIKAEESQYDYLIKEAKKVETGLYL